MLKFIKLKKIMENYKTIFHDLFGDIKLYKVKNDKIIFLNQNNEIIVGKIFDNILTLSYKELNIERYVNIMLPKNYNEDVRVREIIKEKRPNGTIIEQVKRQYGYSVFSEKERNLVYLISKRYVYDKDIKISDIDIYNNDFEKTCKMKTIFESYAKYNKGLKIESLNKTTINNKDISYLYNIVKGENKISRIYDLYNGIINYKNIDDIYCISLGFLKKESLGYINICGITEKEDLICGSSYNYRYNQDYEIIDKFIKEKLNYKEEYNPNDINSLINVIMYKKNINDYIKEYKIKR